MLKLSEDLFRTNPLAKYVDYYERTLYNHILSTQHPEHGGYVYFTPARPRHYRVYSSPNEAMWCCVGSGMESHGLHGDGIYYESGDRLWVNLFVPSTAQWEQAGANIAMETSFPEGDSATLKLTLQKPKQFTLALRRPAWAGNGFQVMVNGKAFKTDAKPGSYVELKRTWKTGDSVSLTLPKTLRIEGLPDNKNIAALMWGPLVLAADLGPERRGGPAEPIPSFVTSDKPVGEWLQPVPDKLGIFHSVNVGRTTDDKERELEFVPFYRLHRRMYGIYFDLYSSDAWSKKLQEIASAQKKQQLLEASTIGFIAPGDQEKEKSFNQQGEETNQDRMTGRAGRRAKKWFSYEIPVDSSKAMALLVTYNTDERGKRSGEVIVDGQLLGEQSIDRSPPGSATGRFFDVEYKLPAELIKDKKKVTVKFQATGGNETATVFGVRTIRGDLER
jgi:hypothetical protein